MRRKVPFLFLVLTLAVALTPTFLQNVHAVFGCRTQPGNTCNFEADSHIPASDGVVQVSISGGGIYNGFCPASCFNLNHTWALFNNTAYTIKVLNPLITGASSGNRYAFKEWDYVGQYFDGSPSNSTMLTPPIYGNYTTAQCYQDVYGNWVNCPFTAVFTVSPPLGCKTNCYMDLLTNVAANEGTIFVRVDGGAPTSLTATFPYAEFAFPNGTGPHTIQVLNTTFTGASSHARYVWKAWNCTCGISATSNPTLSTPIMVYNYTDRRSPPLNPHGAVTAVFDKQYSLTLTFTDPYGNAVSSPSSLQLASGNSVVNVTSFTGVYESAIMWNIRNVAWEGISAVEVAGQTVDLTGGNASIAVKLQVYSAAIKTVDSANNPVAGVTVKVSFLNSTTRTFLTDSQGLAKLGFVPLTSYTAVVVYKNGTICNCVVDARNPQNNPYVVQVVPASGSGTTPLVSAIVLLTIFGLATFLVILAIKVRKPPPPPHIE